MQVQSKPDLTFLDGRRLGSVPPCGILQRLHARIPPLNLDSRRQETFSKLRCYWRAHLDFECAVFAFVQKRVESELARIRLDLLRSRLGNLDRHVGELNSEDTPRYLVEVSIAW